MKIYVSSVGIVSPLGINLEDHHQHLIKEKTGIEKTIIGPELSLFAARVPLSNSELGKDIPTSLPLVSRTELLAHHALKQILDQYPENLKGALISATTVGGMDITENKIAQISAGNISDFNFLKHHPTGFHTQTLAKHFNWEQYSTTISTACSSSVNAILFAARLLKHGKVKRAIAGGSDALCNFTINGFRALKIYSQHQCQPFDQNRDGLNLGEGACYLLLETEASLIESGKNPIAELVGISNTNDAFHATASSPEGIGAYKAMEGAIKMAGINPSQIDYINAHGTATPNNDLSESKALLHLFGQNIPKFSSTKGYTGHTLAAAGAIESAICLSAIKNEVVYPNIGFQTPISETGLIPETKLQKASLSYTLSNSFGFGGNNSSILFSKV